jgi:hypothetical protein
VDLVVTVLVELPLEVALERLTVQGWLSFAGKQGKVEAHDIPPWSLIQNQSASPPIRRGSG